MSDLPTSPEEQALLEQSIIDEINALPPDKIGNTGKKKRGKCFFCAREVSLKANGNLARHNKGDMYLTNCIGSNHKPIDGTIKEISGNVKVESND